MNWRAIVFVLVFAATVSFLNTQVAPSTKPTYASDEFRPVPSQLALVKHTSGKQVSIPEIATMRLGVSRVETVQPMASATELHIEGSLATFLPCFEDYVDDVIILRHPESKIQIDSSSPRDRFLAGMVAVRKIDEALPAYRSNVAVKLYLFLPDNLLDGSGLNEQLTSSNIIPYADAPTPETLGDYLTWTVAHESWHLLDIQARLNRIYEHDKRSLDEIDQILADPRDGKKSFPRCQLPKISVGKTSTKAT